MYVGGGLLSLVNAPDLPVELNARGCVGSFGLFKALGVLYYDHQPCRHRGSILTVMGFIVWDSRESASLEFYFVLRCLGTISVVEHFA